MLGMLLMAVLFYLAIVCGFSAVSFIVGSAYEAGGIWGILGLIALIFFLMWVASKTGGDKNKKK